MSINKKTVYEFGTVYQCEDFFNNENHYYGVNIFVGDEKLGSIIGVLIPDSDNIEQNKEFDNIVINWVVDNNYGNI